MRVDEYKKRQGCDMNADWFKFATILAVSILMVIGSGCVETPVKTKPFNKSQTLDIVGGDESTRQEVNTEWEILFEENKELSLYKGIDYYRNEGYGVTKVTFEYSPTSGTGRILNKKIEDDWRNKSKSEYYISGMKLLLKKESGEVYDTGIILFQKNETWVKRFSVPEEQFVRFKVEEIIISP